MKKFYLLSLIIVLFLAFPGLSQDGKHRYKEAFEKIEELRKIKIIETLQMDEQTTLRFFARRNEHVQSTKALNDSLGAKLSEIETAVKNNSRRLKPLVAEYLNIEKKIINEKANFINSLYNILSDEQVAKLLVFEREFHKEVKKILFKERMKYKD